MNSTNDKIKGNANKAAGSVKSAIGNMTGNKNLKVEGDVQNLKGDAQKTSGAAKDAVNKGIHAAGTAVKKAGEKIRHLAD